MEQRVEKKKDRECKSWRVLCGAWAPPVAMVRSVCWARPTVTAWGCLRGPGELDPLGSALVGLLKCLPLWAKNKVALRNKQQQHNNTTTKQDDETNTQHIVNTAGI